LAVQLPKFKLDCQTCNKTQKRERGCVKDSVIPNAWELDGGKFSRCPKKLITTQSYKYIRAYNFYKEAHLLPNPGIWQEQPLKFIEIVEFIDGVVREGEKG
jgi:hypothetical protein